MNIKSILIQGTANSGKSTTMKEVCTALNPSKVWSLNVTTKERTEDTVENIGNHTYIIEVNGKLILIVAGAPTEQGKSITEILEVCVEIKIEISFIICSMRSFERSDGFDTYNELKNHSELLHREWVERVDGEDFIRTKEWISRIDKIVALVKENI